MTRSGQNGQIVLMGVVLLVFLGTTVVLMLAISTRLGFRSVEDRQATRIRNAALAAITHVVSVFETDPDAWKRALAGDVPRELGFDGHQQFQGIQGIPYTVLCSRDKGLFPDQLKVSVNAWAAGRRIQQNRLFEAILSHPTMGVDLAHLPHAAAALYVLGDLHLEKTGVLPPALEVHWGCIACFGFLQMAFEPNGILYGHHPRKFCRIGYEPPYAIGAKTDNREYWAGISLGDPVEIDDSKYREMALQQTDPHGPAVGDGAVGGFLETNEQALPFRAMGTPDEGRSAPIFYLSGSVRFESGAIDLRQGAMLITRNAIFEDHNSGSVMSLRVPPYADREYPYLPEQREFPCASHLGGECSSQDAMSSDGLVDFRGFLYVKGDLYINQDTVIAGVVRVDGRLRIAQGKKLTIFFDDRVSHAIKLKGRVLERRIISQPI